MTVAAAEAAVGLAIVITVYRAAPHHPGRRDRPAEDKPAMDVFSLAWLIPRCRSWRSRSSGCSSTSLSFCLAGDPGDGGLLRVRLADLLPGAGGAADHHHPWQSSFPWLAISTTTVLPFGFMVDPLAAMMLVVVTTVALLVQIYSRLYREAEAEARSPEATERRSRGDWPHVTHEAADTAHGRVMPRPTARPTSGRPAAGPRPDLRPLLRLPRPVHGRDARSGPLEQPPGHVHVLGGRGPRVVPADRVLVQPDPPDRHRSTDGQEVPIISGPAEAAKKAFVTTRFGDFGFLLGILWLWWHADTLEFTTLVEMAESGALTADPDGRLPAALHGRGRQVGAVPAPRLAPDAMEGPTPGQRADPRRDDGRGRRLHGGRAFPLFEHAPAAMLTVAFIGGFTAIFAASMGLVATDIKRVMAFSTVSQLGYMMLAMGAQRGGRGVPPVHPRLLQGASVPDGRQRDLHPPPRVRTTHWTPRTSADGRPQRPHADHVPDDGDRGALAGGDPAAGRILEQGRDPALDDARGPATLATASTGCCSPSP